MTYVNSVNLTPSTLTLQIGKWYYGAKAEVCPTNATTKSVTWCSSNPSVASVNSSSGYIYARSAGTAKIYATAIDGNCLYLPQKKISCILDVTHIIHITRKYIVIV